MTLGWTGSINYIRYSRLGWPGWNWFLYFLIKFDQLKDLIRQLRITLKARKICEHYKNMFKGTLKIQFLLILLGDIYKSEIQILNCLTTIYSENCGCTFFYTNFFTSFCCFFYTNFFPNNIFLNFKIWCKKNWCKKRTIFGVKKKKFWCKKIGGKKRTIFGVKKEKNLV